MTSVLRQDDRGILGVAIAIVAVVVLVVVLLLMVFVFTPPAPAPKPVTCSLVVVVTWTNSSPVQGATVLVANETNLTNAGGFADFSGLACGPATVTVYPSPQPTSATFAKVSVSVTLRADASNVRSVVVGP